MNYESVLAQNVEILVYGSAKEKFIDFANINNYSSVTYAKKGQTKTGATKIEPINTSSKTDELSKLNSTYCAKINKLQGLFDENKSSHTSKPEKGAILKKSSEPHYFTWGDFKKTTVTISTLNFWIDVNFCLISDMLLDPYINSVISGNTNLLIVTFNPNERESCRKALTLYLKLETDKPPSSIKYQSQRLLLQQGYYHSYNENIVLALCEMPNIEPLGKCLLVGFGNKSNQSTIDQLVKEMKIKVPPRVLIIDETNLEECVQGVTELYDWTMEAHQKMKNTLNLEEGHKKELRDCIKKSFITKHTDPKKECSMF